MFGQVLLNIGCFSFKGGATFLIAEAHTEGDIISGRHPAILDDTWSASFIAFSMPQDLWAYDWDEHISFNAREVLYYGQPTLEIQEKYTEWVMKKIEERRKPTP